MEKLTEESVIVEVVINIAQEARCRRGKRELHLPHYPALSSYTAKTLFREFETNIPRNETAPPRPIYVSVSYLYFPTIGPPILLQK
jgi:hypothetical protein